jgi:hypothetical protein
MILPRFPWKLPDPDKDNHFKAVVNAHPDLSQKLPAKTPRSPVCNMATPTPSALAMLERQKVPTRATTNNAGDLFSPIDVVDGSGSSNGTSSEVHSIFTSSSDQSTAYADLSSGESNSSKEKEHPSTVRYLHRAQRSWSLTPPYKLWRAPARWATLNQTSQRWLYRALHNHCQPSLQLDTDIYDLTNASGSQALGHLPRLFRLVYNS